MSAGALVMRGCAAVAAAIDAVLCPGAFRAWCEDDFARSAATGRECGGHQPEGVGIGRQPVIGLHMDRGPSDGVTYTGQGTGNLSRCGCSDWSIAKAPSGFRVIRCAQCPSAGAAP